MIAEDLVLIETQNGTFKVVNILLEFFLIQYHILLELDLLLLQFCQSVFDLFVYFFGVSIYLPSLVQFIDWEFVAKSFQHGEDIHALIDLNLHLFQITWNIVKHILHMNQFLDALGLGSDLSFHLIEFSEESSGLFSRSLGDQINKVLLEGIVSASKDSNEILSVDGEARDVDFFGD